jgi:hypothetical protein
MLQAYALQRKIQDLGFQVEYIEYHFKEVMPSYKKRLWIRIKRLGVYLFHLNIIGIKSIFVLRRKSKKDCLILFIPST